MWIPNVAQASAASSDWWHSVASFVAGAIGAIFFRPLSNIAEEWRDRVHIKQLLDAELLENGRWMSSVDFLAAEMEKKSGKESANLAVFGMLGLVVTNSFDYCYEHKRDAFFKLKRAPHILSLYKGIKDMQQWGASKQYLAQSESAKMCAKAVAAFLHVDYEAERQANLAKKKSPTT